jgi:dienelactone hydrolase
MTSSVTVRLTHAGADLEGYLALPNGPGPHRAVMVMHNAHGLGEHMRQVARSLADAGYAALATDMYGGGRHFSNPQAAGAAIAPLWEDPRLLRSRVLAWYQLFYTRPEVNRARLGAIGYCFGGQCVLELARSGADVKAVASYHGILKTTMPAEAGAVKAQVAVYTGAKDPYAPRDDVNALREEMMAAGAHWQITEFGDAYHAFTDSGASETHMPGLAYDPLAERISWAGTIALLEATL